MRIRRLRHFLAALLAAALISGGGAEAVRGEEREKAPELYAQSAVLMDGDSGRILYGKMREKSGPWPAPPRL